MAGLDSRNAHIINIASAHGLADSAHEVAYVAVKHGVVGLTKVIGLETAGSGVTVNAVCPGWVLTPLVEKQIADIAAERGTSRDDAAAALLGEKQPSRTFVTPEQLGGTIVFCARLWPIRSPARPSWSMVPGLRNRGDTRVDY